MWDTEKQRQLDDLRARAEGNTLTPEEQERLDQLLHELEQMEWSTFRPALDALRQEKQVLQAELSQLRTQNAVLAALAERYADLLARAKVQLAGLVSEQEMLRSEYDRVLR